MKRLCDSYDNCSFKDGVTLGYVYSSHGAAELSLYVILHFHGLEYCNHLTRFHDITDIHLYSDYYTRKW